MKTLRFVLTSCLGLLFFDQLFADEITRELDCPDYPVGSAWSVDHEIRTGKAAALVCLKTPGSYSGDGLGYRYYGDAEMEVLVSIWGRHEPAIKGRYRIHTDYAKSTDPLKVGTTMIVIGQYHPNRPSLSISRYIYPTPENMKRVVASIRQWHGRELAKDPEGTARLEKALAANLDAYQPPSPPPRPAVRPASHVPQSPQQEWPLWLGAMLILVLTAAGWRWWRRSSD